MKCVFLSVDGISFIPLSITKKYHKHAKPSPYQTHPLHPILVAFPIAFFTGTLVFDILAFAGNDEYFAHTAYYLLISGIAMALIAAVPGTIDFLHTVPPASSAKKRAGKHAPPQSVHGCTVWRFTDLPHTH